MREFVVCMIAGLLVSSNIRSQEIVNDSATVLQEVIVKAYENNRKLIEVPAAVSVIGKHDLRRFDNTSLLPAFNASPGVRMEERSPGSYRLNIRGSSLRSPFGIRNVKVYYNDIPYTDPGGHTFLNQLGFYNISGVEIIKGPGSSMYGAGTGGVVLLKGDLERHDRGATVDYTRGSFGMNNFHITMRGGKTEQLHHAVSYQYQNSNGYRDHTKMERKVLSWDGVAKLGAKGTLKVHFLQGDLFYQTPGALTLAEYNADPKAARPRVGQTPGSAEAHAAINQKLFMAGFNYVLIWNDHWQNSTSLYGSYSLLTNPTTRNYERRTEPHYGSRNVLQYKDKLGSISFTWHGGAEVQQGIGASRVYQNKAGNPDTLLTDDEINTASYSVFTQASFELPHNWIVTAGASLNLLKVELLRLSLPSSMQKRNYNNELAPRIALLKKISPAVSAYASLAKGFSPPTNAELLPSTGVISTELEAEKGWNTEMGIRGSLKNGRLYFDLNTFYFRLNNTITQRRDQSGGDYFVNSGSTRQFGVETYLSYRLVEQDHPFLRDVKCWISHTWHNFHYHNYQRVAADTADFSGKRLPSIPRHYVAAGWDVYSKPGWYANLSYYYSDPLPLNDANTDFASSYNLFGARLGYRKLLRENMQIDVYAAADNIFDVSYSLGNDINAFGSRYFNAAPGANYAGGITVRYSW